MASARMMSRKMLLGSLSKEVAAKFLRERGRELVEAIRSALPESYRYVMILKDGEAIAYFSDESKEDAIRMLEDIFAHLKGEKRAVATG
jgi:hypothetical protein